jgi:ubiquinone/menaquinone biosynthesis C-methylase UbiE
MPQGRTHILKVGEYLMAIEGLAMMRHILTDPARGRERGRDVQRILENLERPPQSLDLPVTEHDVATGYTAWAPLYDGEANLAIEREEPIVRSLIEQLPPGSALDAACGTGRQAAMLDELGHRVIGVDATEAMLAIARTKVPAGEFRRGALETLPVDASSVDLVTCALALTHVPALAPVMAEFRRVLRPGGRVILSDMHPFTAMTSGVAVIPRADRSLGVPFVENRVHHHSEYIKAFHDAGLRIETCIEPTITDDMIPRFPTYALIPEGTRDALLGMPWLLIWQLAS